MVIIRNFPMKLSFASSRMGSQVAIVVKNSPANAGDLRDTG